MPDTYYKVDNGLRSKFRDKRNGGHAGSAMFFGMVLCNGGRGTDNQGKQSRVDGIEQIVQDSCGR